MYEALPAFLVRAPLLAERELRRAGSALLRHPLGGIAIRLASPSLSRSVSLSRQTTEAAGRAVERYGRRAAVRATPQGLLAGVCLGELGARTSVATGVPRAWLAPTWERMAALGRALIADEPVRERVRLRVAPSLVRGATTARWLAPGDPFLEERVVSLDQRLAAILETATRFAPWAEVRGAAAGHASADRSEPAEREELDDLLLMLVDDGLLHADVTPPLVGPAAPAWMSARLEALGLASLARALDASVAALAMGDLAEGERALAALPGARAEDAGIQAVLVHRPAGRPRLARVAVERAAALAPLLFRLQDALVPPASERLAQPQLDAALDAVTEVHGAGAIDLEAFAAGDYGVSPGGPQHDDDDDGGGAIAAAPSAALLALLVDTLVAAARTRSEVATLDVAALAAACGGVGPAPPPTCELFLSPAARPRGAPEGTGWLLGLHAPAGASWGRFAAALGAPLARALDALAAAERAARPHEETLDVVFAPSPAHADLGAHPPTRRRALALTAWPHDEAAALSLRDLALVAAPGSATPLSLRAAAGGGPVAPSPLGRVRSTTAPAGVTRLLAGWSLYRQHAPWALALGPLATVTRVPRLVMDGFVVAPASWRVPATPAGRALTRPGLRRWRREARLPRWVHVGQEDQLLPVDLDAPDAPDALAGHDRVWEIWPPLGAPVDRDGRRIEAVVALVDRPDAEEGEALAHAARGVAAAGRVRPPRIAPPPGDFATFKLFGAREHQEAVLVGAVGPTIAAARRAREISSWFFLRYVDGPGQRHHLRVRVSAPTPAARAAFEARLAAALAPTRAAGDVTTVETADYHPERARWGAALDAVHAIFQSDSQLALDLLHEAALDDEADGAPMVSLVGSLDALAQGLDLDLAARRSLARARRAAEEALVTLDAETRAETDAELRAHARALRTLLGRAGAADARTRALESHVARTRRATKGLDATARASLAPALLHLACVRLAGPGRDLERRAYTLWERTLEGLLKSPPERKA